MKVENNKELRIMKKKILKITLSIVLILILAAGIGLTYLVGAAGGG
jgi:flagellar basal body-associated protein FliL